MPTIVPTVTITQLPSRGGSSCNGTCAIPTESALLATPPQPLYAKPHPLFILSPSLNYQSAADDASPNCWLWFHLNQCKSESADRPDANPAFIISAAASSSPSSSPSLAATRRSLLYGFLMWFHSGSCSELSQFGEAYRAPCTILLLCAGMCWSSSEWKCVWVSGWEGKAHAGPTQTTTSCTTPSLRPTSDRLSACWLIFIIAIRSPLSTWVGGRYWLRV